MSVSFRRRLVTESLLVGVQKNNRILVLLAEIPVVSLLSMSGEVPLPITGSLVAPILKNLSDGDFLCMQ